jgi:threonine synthase
MKTIQQSYPELANALNIPDVYLKREDLHKYGSHKGRSLPIMIKKYSKVGPYTSTIGGPYQEFVISSSGNAALAAIHAVQAHNRNNTEKIKLKVYIGQNINPEKLKVLMAVIEDANISLEQVDNPKQEAYLEDKSGTKKFLRQSTDDLALEGYFELAEELSKIPNLEAVFVPTSSGTTAQGLHEAFKKLNCQVQIHIVQTTACHPMVDDTKNTETSIADAIVDNIAHRKEKVLEILKNSKGNGWIATDEEIKNAINLVEDTCKVKISPNSALSVAGLKKSLENNWKFSGPVVCLITGR